MIRFKSTKMFIARFKQFLGSLPPRDDGYGAMKDRLRNEDWFSNPAAEFFIRLTNYAAVHSTTPSTTHYDVRLLMNALYMTRFPIEVLGVPEEPLRFSLLNSAWKFLRVIDTILSLHNPSEDDNADDLLSDSLCVDYMLALNEYFTAQCAVMEQSVVCGGGF